MDEIGGLADVITIITAEFQSHAFSTMMIAGPMSLSC
jgi:hypothetical protein